LKPAATVIILAAKLVGSCEGVEARADDESVDFVVVGSVYDALSGQQPSGFETGRTDHDVIKVSP